MKQTEILNTKSAGDLLDCSEGAIRIRVYRKQLPFRKIGGRLFFLRDELMQFVHTAPGLRLADVQAQRAS